MSQTELTRSQIRRQDFVDNEIHWLLTHLIEDLHPQNTSYGWNIEDIAKVREVCYEIIKDWTANHSNKHEPIEEMEFYPYLESDYVPCDQCKEYIAREEYNTNKGLCTECVEMMQ